jgi:hypothetical protein
MTEEFKHMNIQKITVNIPVEVEYTEENDKPYIVSIRLPQMDVIYTMVIDKLHSTSIKENLSI